MGLSRGARFGKLASHTSQLTRERPPKPLHFLSTPALEIEYSLPFLNCGKREPSSAAASSYFAGNQISPPPPVAMMAASSSSRTRSSGSVLGRSLSPGGRLCSSSPYAPPSSFSSASAFASSTSSSFSAARSATAFSFHSHQRSASPTRVHLAGISSSGSPTSTSFRLSIAERPTSPGRSLSVSNRDHQIVRKPVAPPAASQRRTCMCSPTTHPGSFRCALHKNARYHPHSSGGSVTAPSRRLNMRRSAMTNSLVRIGTVEGSDLIKRALATLIRPSSHQQRRRADFHPRPSRLSVMSKADDLS